LLSVIFIPSWVPNLPFTSVQLFVAGGLLLFVVGLMIGIRKQRVSVQRSYFTDELMGYLGRIADALERQADRPTVQEIANMIDRRIAEHRRNAETNPAAGAGDSSDPKSRAVAYSMFGREYPEKS
jgi:hypothetical protein